MSFFAFKIGTQQTASTACVASSTIAMSNSMLLSCRDPAVWHVARITRAPLTVFATTLASRCRYLAMSNIRRHNSLFPQFAHLFPLLPPLSSLDCPLLPSLPSQIIQVASNLLTDVADERAIIPIGCPPIQRLLYEILVHARRVPETQDGAGRQEAGVLRLLGERVQAEQEVIEGQVGGCGHEDSGREGRLTRGWAGEELENGLDERMRLARLMLARFLGGQLLTPGGPWMHATVSARRQNSIASFWLSFSAGLYHLIPSPSAVGGTPAAQVGGDIPSSALIRGQLAWFGVGPSDGSTRRRRCSSVRRMRSYVAEFASLTLRVSADYTANIQPQSLWHLHILPLPDCDDDLVARHLSSDGTAGTSSERTLYTTPSTPESSSPFFDFALDLPPDVETCSSIRAGSPLRKVCDGNAVSTLYAGGRQSSTKLSV